MGEAAPSAGAAACPVSRVDKPWLDAALSPECRADALIARLGTLDEKLAILGGGGLARFGISEPGASDGPAGPVHAPGAASLPNGLALAASFDPAMAAAYGSIVGREFRRAGAGRMLGPTIDIARTWHAGRVPESLGEDPFLSARIAAAMVKAVQDQGVAATLKHFAVYTQEQGRTGDMPFGLKPAVNNILTERAIREIYLPPFQAAVIEGGALGVMCAFPRVNGVYACENPLLLGILKREWKFRGTVAPDFPDAQRSVVEAVNAGLDAGNFGLPRPDAPKGGAKPQEGPTPGMDLGAALGMNRTPGGVDLATAIRSGRVSVARLDDMIRRQLVGIFAVGADQPIKPDPRALGGPDADALALRVAEDGAVLLRNEGGLLPFGPAVRSIALIGAQAGASPQVATSGSAYVQPRHHGSALEAIRARAAGSVTYAKGSLGVDALAQVPAAVLRTSDGAAGLRADYVANADLRFDATPIASRIEPGVDIATPAPIEGLPANNGWSVRWSGRVVPRHSGIHSFTISGAGSGRLFVDNVLVARFDRVDFGAIGYATVPLEEGKPVALRVEFTPREAAPLPGIAMMGTSLGTLMRLGWAEPDTRIAEAVAAARSADVAVVFAADRHGEGADRSELKLPGDQDALIAAVAAANPNTVVVLDTAGPVSMPWANKVRSILELWYPGDAFAAAASGLLFGDAAPGGRLPITFPLDESQGPTATVQAYPGTVGQDGGLEARFDEGLLVGYRWYDAKRQMPLYPFGHGLTYAPMRTDRITARKTAMGAKVDATVHNLGRRADSEVVQVYVGFPAGAGEPPKRLAAFQKVRLAAGASAKVTLVLPASAFMLWDEGGWRTPAGPFEILVGRSSRDIIYRGTIRR